MCPTWSPLPMNHCVGRCHGLDHEGCREVGHEGQHDDDDAAQGPSEIESNYVSG